MPICLFFADVCEAPVIHILTGHFAQDIEVEWEGSGGAGSQGLTAHYVLRKVGSYSVAVTYTGVHVKGSPWPLQVLAGAGRAAHSSLGGLPSRLTAGQPTRLILVARDEYGNPTAGGDTIVFAVDSFVEGDRIAGPRESRR